MYFPMNPQYLCSNGIPTMYHILMKKAIDGEDDELVLCSLRMDNKNKNKKKNCWFTKDVKMPMEADMMFIINGKHFFVHKEHMDWRLRCIMSHHK